MNREIKFRGKRIDNGEWVYGYLVDSNIGTLIVEEACFVDGAEWNLKEYIVDKKSVGQYTGLKDKNGVEIYEGDILDYESYNKYEVYFINGKFMACNELDYDINNYYYNKVKVIGNIYENKELLN